MNGKQDRRNGKKKVNRKLERFSSTVFDTNTRFLSEISHSISNSQNVFAERAKIQRIIKYKKKE